MFAYVIAALLPTAQLELGGHSIEVEIADTPRTRARGLMGRKTLEEGHGMLFVFDRPQLLSFWMKNTLIPLSVGFFDSEKRLLNTVEMEVPGPGDSDLPSYESQGPAQYALEMPKGWFRKTKIRKGMKFTLHDQSHEVK